MRAGPPPLPLTAPPPGMADGVLVNSQFTLGVFRRAFPRLSAVTPRVLYPAIRLRDFDAALTADSRREAVEGLPPALQAVIRQGRTVLLSINRFERKKQLDVVLRAFARARCGTEAHVVMAGGYDPRVRENREHLVELQDLARGLGIAPSVSFVPSFSEAQKHVLLQACTLVVYSPPHEHFGIVPIEAMCASR